METYQKEEDMGKGKKENFLCLRKQFTMLHLTCFRRLRFHHRNSWTISRHAERVQHFGPESLLHFSSETTSVIKETEETSFVHYYFNAGIKFIIIKMTTMLGILFSSCFPENVSFIY